MVPKMGAVHLHRFEEPNPLRLFLSAIQQERNHERVFANERVYLKPCLCHLAVRAIQPILIRAGTPPCFAADCVLSLGDNPSLWICHNGRDNRGRFLPYFAESIEIPALSGAGFSEFFLCSNVLQEGDRAAPVLCADRRAAPRSADALPRRQHVRERLIFSIYSGMSR